MSTYGSTSTDNQSTPLSSVYVPNTPNSDLTPLEGYGPINTDSNTPPKTSAPASVGIKDGNDATFGAQANAAATSDTGTFSYMALFKRLLAKFPTIGPATKANSVSVTFATDNPKAGVTAASGDFADGAVTTLGQAGDANTVSTVMGRLTKIRDLLATTLAADVTDRATRLLGHTVTDSGSVTDVSDRSGRLIGTEANSAAIKSDLDTISTNTTTSATQNTTTATNTTTLAGIVTSNKAAIKAASGDFTDGAIVTLGQAGDANTVNTVMGRLTKLRDLLAATLTADVTDRSARLLGHTVTDSGSVTDVSDRSARQIGTEANSAAIKSDLDTIVTNTNKIPASPATEGGNLASIKTDADSIVTNTSNTSSVLGATGDAAVVGDTTGTVSAKMRGLTKILNDIWDSVNHRIHVNVDNANSNGQATMANSAPVVIASDQSNVAVKGALSEQTSLSAGSLNADLVPFTDMSVYNWWSLQVLSVAAGSTLTFQGSNDNSTWVTILGYNANSSGAPVPSITSTGLFYGPRNYRYIRIRQTVYGGSGSSTGVFEAYTTASQIVTQSLNASQSGTWTVQPGNTQNTTPWLTAGPTANFTQAANTAGVIVGKASAGYLWSAVVTTLGTAQLDIYDNASTNSGTKLLSIPASAAVGTIYSFQGGARASNGITSNGVTNCPAVTFHYS